MGFIKPFERHGSPCASKLLKGKIRKKYSFPKSKKRGKKKIIRDIESLT